MKAFRTNAIPMPLLAAVLATAGCAPAPFDADAPWVPMQAAEGSSFAGGVRGAAPRMGFELFESERPPAEAVSLPRAGGENPWATPTRNVVVSVCYGRLFDSAAEVRATARELCPAGARLRLLSQDHVWNDCPLFQPSRAVYRCLPPETAESGAAGTGSGAE